jgi:hypothetical protein
MLVERSDIPPWWQGKGQKFKAWKWTEADTTSQYSTLTTQLPLD